MINDYEDDTHYCLKCHTTIIGLDNYVAHRKSKCGKALNDVSEITKPPISPELLQSGESFSLKADDFFSSLELQSSAKKLTNPTTGGKTFSGVLTRSKASAVIQASSSGKDAFNYLEHGKSESSEWVSDHHISQSRQEQKKESEAALQIYGDSEEESDEYDYEDEDSEYDDEYDHDGPPRSFTGGKWKPTSSPIQWLRPPSSNDDRDWNTPPPTHTGAKWKPQSEHSGGKWKYKESYEVPPSNFTGSKWTPSKLLSKNETFENKGIKTKSQETKIEDVWEYQNEPPPEHTKGKWKPASLHTTHDDPPSYIESNNDKLEQNAPPVTYTKGKWKPIGDESANTSNVEVEVSPLRKSSGTVQYWCVPCNRRLASKIVYERHLKSELHFKRTLQDREFEDSSYLNVNLSKNENVEQKSPTFFANVDTKENLDELDEKNVTTGHVRRKLFVTCNVCKSRVNSHLMGKHLISHYHCRRVDINSQESRKMVLENIHSIILQSPYQCNPCKFYCNTHERFLEHWVSETHKEIVLTTESFFWCTVCKFQARSSEEMYAHLLSEEHDEIISVINRSVPIIIKKLTPIKCSTCDQKFLFNFQLRKHCERENHLQNLTSSDDYQNKHKCNRCDAILSSKIALQRHQILKHNEKLYFCSVCSLNFDSIIEAKRHRSTPKHRCAVLEKRHKEGLEKSVSKTCQYCADSFQNILKLKEHLKKIHPEYNHSCPHCGKLFTIPQDLTVHIRTKACTFEENNAKSNSCDQCKFKTDSSSELLFHKILHDEPLITYNENLGCSASSSKRPIPQYKCPICEKLYEKSSLRCHLRIHTKERPFVCSLCNAGFVRKNNWVVHMKNHDRTNIRKLEAVNRTAEYGERPFLCSTCGASFKKRSILQQHMKRHTGKSIKCTESGCVFSARFPAELKLHLHTHSDDKPYCCQLCDYRGKTKQQLDRHKTVHEDDKKYRCPHCAFTTRLASHLKRHMRLHTGAKPFACPHCDYCCNNLENLRKHVLSTNKHPGKCLYECKFCEENPYETNLAKEFKVHLMITHPDAFSTGKEAATYTAGIYEAVNDRTSIGRFSERAIQKGVLQVEETLSQFQDSTRTSSSRVLLTSVTTQDSSEPKIPDELFSMLIVSKDVVCIENPSEPWNIGGNYDVEESGSLVPFHSEGETLFHEHFQ